MLTTFGSACSSQVEGSCFGKSHNKHWKLQHWCTGHTFV